MLNLTDNIALNSQHESRHDNQASVAASAQCRYVNHSAPAAMGLLSLSLLICHTPALKWQKKSRDYAWTQALAKGEAWMHYTASLLCHSWLLEIYFLLPNFLVCLNAVLKYVSISFLYSLVFILSYNIARTVQDEYAIQRRIMYIMTSLRLHSQTAYYG